MSPHGFESHFCSFATGAICNCSHPPQVWAFWQGYWDYIEQACHESLSGVGSGGEEEEEEGQKADGESLRDFRPNDPLAARPARPRLRPTQDDLFQISRPPSRPAYLSLDR